MTSVKRNKLVPGGGNFKEKWAPRWGGRNLVETGGPVGDTLTRGFGALGKNRGGNGGGKTSKAKGKPVGGKGLCLRAGKAKMQESSL